MGKARINEQDPRLYFDISMEVVAAMNKTMLKSTGSSDLIHFLVEKNQETHENIAITIQPFAEPSHPERFTKFKVQPLNILLHDNCFEDSAEWNHSVKTIIDNSEPESKEPMEMYCETNNSTHIRISYYFRRIGHDGQLLGWPTTLPFGFRAIRRLASLLLAFEDEIDKLLADNVGYVTHHASALSNTHNRILRNYSATTKLEHLWKKCSTPTEIIELMCPDFLGPQTRRSPKRHYKYHLEPLLRKNDSHIEFRQHHGTLNSDEIVHWILFTGNLVELARRAGDADILRLVHYADTDSVNLLELFHTMAAWQLLTPDVTAMMRYYCRRSMARGTRLRVKTRLRLRRIKASVRALTWRDVSPDCVVGADKPNN